jgi:hypothetical protein
MHKYIYVINRLTVLGDFVVACSQLVAYEDEKIAREEIEYYNDLYKDDEEIRYELVKIPLFLTEDDDDQI